MKMYNQAKLEVEEFILNAEIATASSPDGPSNPPVTDPSSTLTQYSANQQGGGGGLSAGIEFEILANGNDEI